MRKNYAVTAISALLFAGPMAATAVAVDAPATSGNHCVLSAETGHIRCTDTLEQAEQLVASAADVNAVRLYNGTGYDGATLTITTNGKCSSGYDREYKVDDLDNWRNRASSVRTYNRCDVKLFNKVNLKGASSTWIDKSSNLNNVGSGWSNRANSVRIS